MLWGTHELDSQHYLALAVLEALSLLRDMAADTELPRPDEGLRLDAKGMRRLVMRCLSLDTHLQLLADLEI